MRPHPHLLDTYKKLVLPWEDGVRETSEFQGCLAGLLSRSSEGSCVLLQNRDSMAFATLFLGALSAGIKPIVVPARWDQARVDALLQDLRIPLASINNQLVDGARSNALSIQGDFATLTSGSTSTPKLCEFLFERTLANAKLHSASLGISSDNTIFQTLPLDHIFGIVAYIATPLVTGCRVALAPMLWSWVQINKHEAKNKTVHMTSFLAQHFLEKTSFPVNDWAVLSLGASLIERETLLKLGARGAQNLFVTYGATELGPRVSTLRFDAKTYETGQLGKAFAGIEVKLSDNGQLMVKTPTLSSNQETDTQGFFLTQDQFEISKDGQLKYLSRAGSYLKVRGHRVSRETLSSLLKESCGLTSFAILPSETDGFDLAVASTLPAETLRKLIATSLAVYLQPNSITIVDHIPVTSLGKVDMMELKALLQRKAAAK